MIRAPWEPDCPCRAGLTLISLPVRASYPCSPLPDDRLSRAATTTLAGAVIADVRAGPPASTKRTSRPTTSRWVTKFTAGPTCIGLLQPSCYCLRRHSLLRTRRRVNSPGCVLQNLVRVADGQAA